MRSLLLILGFLILDSAHTDPCEDHTVLRDTWRSTSCRRTECVRDVKCDYDLPTGWYRFKSSGGWKISEIPVAPGHCSTSSPGWLEGSHPTLEQGEGSGTVCFTGIGNPCSWKQEIKIKNCGNYFVYELKPTKYCKAAYCTDPGTAPTLGADDKSQPESTDPASRTPTESPTSGTATPPTRGDQSTRESSEQSSSVPAGSPTSDFGSQTINVEISSVTELDDDAAKKVAVRKVQQMFQDQSPKQPIDWDQAEVQRWDMDEPDP